MLKDKGVSMKAVRNYRPGQFFSALTLCLLFVLGTSGCAKHEQTQAATPSKPAEPLVKAAPATPIDAAKVKLGGDTWIRGGMRL